MTQAPGVVSIEASSTDAYSMFPGGPGGALMTPVPFGDPPWHPPEEGWQLRRVLGFLVLDWIYVIGGRLRIYDLDSTVLYNLRIETRTDTPLLPYWIEFGNGIWLEKPWTFRLSCSSGSFRGLLQAEE